MRLRECDTILGCLLLSLLFLRQGFHYVVKADPPALTFQVTDLQESPPLPSCSLFLVKKLCIVKKL